MDTSRVIDNRTVMQARCLPMDDRHGREVLVVVAKMTWAVAHDGKVTVADPPARVRPGAESWPDPPSSQWPADRYPSDFVDEKPGTDVLLVGTAHPPAGSEITEMGVGFRLVSGTSLLEKTLRVYGPRVWHKGMLGVAPGPATRVTPTQLRWENTYGGVDESIPNDPYTESRNPIGSGHARDRSTLVGQPAPLIEDPRAPLSARKPMPAGFGPVASSWAPRAGRAGTYDAAWRRERAPLRPLDFDPRFNSVAADDQWCDQPLGGDEAVEVVGVSPEGPWRFRLPRYAPVFRSRVGSEECDCPTHLDTFLIDADSSRVELVWRTSVPMPRKSELIRWVQIWASDPLPEDLMADLFGRTRNRSEAP
jgi:hypothetical protein